MAERDVWSSKTGFILASVGAAMGLVPFGSFPIGLVPMGEQYFFSTILTFYLCVGGYRLMGEFAFGRSEQYLLCKQR